MHYLPYFFFFFFNDTATTEIYTLSLHDALPISLALCDDRMGNGKKRAHRRIETPEGFRPFDRSEEHTSELQSRLHLVCRLLLEKKKNGSDRRLAITIDKCRSNDTLMRLSAS